MPLGHHIHFERFLLTRDSVECSFEESSVRLDNRERIAITYRRLRENNLH